MRIFSVLAVSALLGCIIGGAMAYVSVGPATTAGGGSAAANQSADGVPAQLPIVEIDSAQFHFGTMQRGTTRSHLFRFTNRGTIPLELRAGATSCKCTMVDLAEAALSEGEAAADQPIPPGGSANVKLKWTAAVPPGPFRQTAQVLTNDPRAPRIELTVEGEVTEVTGLYPPLFSFDKLRPGETKDAEVQLVAFGDDPLEVKDARIKDPMARDFFDVEITPLEAEELAETKAKSGVRIELKNKPHMPLGLFMHQLVVKTNLPDKEELEIPVEGRVVGDITFHGRGWNEELGVLHLGIVNGAKGAESKLLISTKGEHADDIAFEVVSSDPSELEAKIGEAKLVSPGVHHTYLLISIPPGTPPMIHLDTAQGEQGQIILKSNHPQTPEVVLPVRFAVER